MSERRFTHGLKKPGNAAKIRESVSQAIRDSYIPVGKRTYTTHFNIRIDLSEHSR